MASKYVTRQMPTYEFRCPNGHEFTHFYKTMSTAQTQLPCPQCKATADRQMSAGAGFAFKGSGFYLTDYGKNAHRGGEKSTSKVEPATSGSGEKKADSGASGKSEAPKADAAKPKAESKETKATSKPSSE